MNLLTFMQKVPTTQEKLCIEYIADGLREIQKVTSENLSSATIDLVADQMEYDFPSDFVAFKHIYIDKDNVTDYYMYSASIEGRKIVVVKQNALGNMVAPDESISEALTLYYTAKDTGFSDTSIDVDSEFNVRDEVIDALLEYVRWQLAPLENPAMRSIFERKFFGKANDIEFIRSRQFSVVPKPYLRSLRTNYEEII